MKITVLTLAVLTLAACTTASKTVDSEGEPAIMVECSRLSGLSSCNERAEKECGGPFKVLSSGVGNTYYMVVKCK